MSGDKFGTKYDRLFVAALTPLKTNYKVDEPGLRKLLKYFMQKKFVSAGGAIIINPEAGDIFYLTREEKRRSVEIALEECGDKVAVFAGVAALRTEDSIIVAKDAKEVGADGIFLIPPMGAIDVTTSWNADKFPEVWIDMAKAQVEAVDLPAIAHPTASPSPLYGIGLPLEATLKMCKDIPNIIGWKMVYAYPGWVRVARALRSLNRHVAVMGASAHYFHENLATDYFDGTVTGSFNYAMEPMIDHIKAWRARNLDDANRIWKSGLEDLHYYVYEDYGRLHVKYKAAAWLRGLVDFPLMRPPMPKPRKEEILTLYDLLKKTGLSVIPKNDLNTFLKKL